MAPVVDFWRLQLVPKATRFGPGSSFEALMLTRGKLIAKPFGNIKASLHEKEVARPGPCLKKDGPNAHEFVDEASAPEPGMVQPEHAAQ